jgi:Cd2+/Zn2+-exporting ATPase
MTRKQKKMLKKIIISLILFLIVLFTNIILENCFSSFEYGLASIIPSKTYGFILPFVLYFTIYIYIGFNVLKKSFINIIHGQIFDENFLMAVATLCAF